MIMKLFRYLSVILTAALVAACVDPLTGPVLEGENLIPLNIDGSIRQVQTKATAQGFVDKDAVGLFAVNYTDNNATPGTLLTSGNQADNVKYVFDEPNQKWVPVRPVYYKNVNTHADLYLYYPYQGTISDINAANFEVKKDQSSAATTTSLSGYEASDWMWGKGEDITPSESKVRVQLAHRLSAVEVSLTEGSGFNSGEFASLDKNVILTGTTRKATLNYATGEATPIGSAQLDGIVMCPQDGGSWRAVVIPQTVEGGTQLFSITIGGTSYAYRQSDAIEYQSGKQMNVSLTINKKTPSGDYEIAFGNTTITDWTEDRYAHGGEARQYFVVNVTTPGTLQATIEAAGKNPAKIKNLKVTGQVNTDDFHFMRDQMTILEAVNMKECRISAVIPAGWYEKNGEWGNWPEEICEDVIPTDAFRDKQSLFYFVFPEVITEIYSGAFAGTNLAGPLILPEKIVAIDDHAFTSTKISSIHFPESLEFIGANAFESTGCSGQLLLPEGLRFIGCLAFSGCDFSGFLQLPETLEIIAPYAFQGSGSFTGGLSIPKKITELYEYTFNGTSFSGPLVLNNVHKLEKGVFQACNLSGELILPEGMTIISDAAFCGNRFSSVAIPSTVITIESSAFANNNTILEPIIFPEGLRIIGSGAFAGCSHIPSIILPTTLLFIEGGAFSDCFGITAIVCGSLEPPRIQGDSFDGVGKDNFTLEVPEQSIIKYQTDPIWSDFKRIAAHHDFSISRSVIQALNAVCSKTLTLRAPSGLNWSIQSKPDWVTVSPSSGTGKTDVTITISSMARTNDAFEVNEGSFNHPSYVTYQGRSGEVVFLLEEKDYTSTLTVEQYDSSFTDGTVHNLQTHSLGSGINIVFTGDGYSARDIAKGTFIANAQDGYGHFFDIEPYKTYKDYFNVYAVTAMSDESGIGTLNTIVDTKFGSTFTQNRIKAGDADAIFEWTKKADDGMDLAKSLIILLMNTSTYEGVTMMYTDGSAIAYCPVSTEAYPYDFRGIVQHEAGGHGFGKLGDEYIYHNAFIQNCDCLDGCDHPQNDDDVKSNFGIVKSLGWYRNLSMESDFTRVPWAHLIYLPQYSDYVDVFEGGYMHSRGMYRSEATSCMNNNIPYYSAISRQAIVERIMYCAGEEFSLQDFYAHDSRAVGPKTKGSTFDPTFGVDPNYCRATGQGPILVGDHPNVK